MSFVDAITRVKELLSVPSIIAVFPDGVKEVLPRQAIGKVNLPALRLVSLPDARRIDPGSRVSKYSLRTYQFSVVAIFSRRQDIVDASISSAVDTIWEALEGQYLISASSEGGDVEPIKVVQFINDSSRLADIGDAYFQYELIFTGMAYYKAP